MPTRLEALVSALFSWTHCVVAICTSLAVWAGGWVLNRPAPNNQPEPMIVFGPIRDANPELEWKLGNWKPNRDNVIRRNPRLGFNSLEKEEGDCRYMRVHCADAYVISDRDKVSNVAIWGRIRTRDVGKRPFGPATQVYQVTIEDQPDTIYQMKETEWDRVPYGFKLQINWLCERGKDRGHIAFYRSAVTRDGLLLGDALDCVLWQRGWTIPVGWKVVKDTDQRGDYPILEVNADKPVNGNFPFQRDE